MSYLSDIKVTTRYPIDWETSKRIAEATKALLIPESNLDRNNPESLMFRGEVKEIEAQCPLCGLCDSPMIRICKKHQIELNGR